MRIIQDGFRLPGGMFRVELTAKDGARIFRDRADYDGFIERLTAELEEWRIWNHALVLKPDTALMVTQIYDRCLYSHMRRVVRPIKHAKLRLDVIWIYEFAQLLEVVREIHRSEPDPEYPYNSHATYLGRARMPGITTSQVLSAWDGYDQVEQYQRFIELPPSSPEWAGLEDRA